MKRLQRKLMVNKCLDLMRQGKVLRSNFLGENDRKKKQRFLETGSSYFIKFKTPGCTSGFKLSKTRLLFY